MATDPAKTAPNDHFVDDSSSLAKRKCKSIDFQWEDLSVIATKKLKKIENGKKINFTEKKRILNHVTGVLKHGTFTAIMGPSGCGKTTLLNVLSNRIDNRLEVRGKLFINSQQVNSIHSIANLVAFVQQDDILLPTITPREIFTFTANLRLKLPPQEKKLVVESLLEELGLLRCANTKVGNNLIRGLSGGERKRTSIGVELITNPSMVFLDEPTTGLDSTTALKIIEVLRNLAAHGRTIVSVIHQPSSEIYNEFHYLMLMVRGDIIYTGLAKEAVKYFDGIGYKCPKFTNPADYFMKIMSETGLIVEEMKQSMQNGHPLSLEQEDIESRFAKRLEAMVSNYQKNYVEVDKSTLLNDVIDNKHMFQTSWCTQFSLLLGRSLKNEFRNPLDFMMKTVQNIVMALCMIVLWNNISNGLTGVQDRTGVLFMLTTACSMVSMGGSVGVFSLERPVFIRERLNQSYKTTAYFWAKTTAEFPMFLVYVFVLTSMMYWAVGLNTYDDSKYFLTVAICYLMYIAGSGIGILVSTFVPSVEVAMALMPVIMVPLFACAGFFVNQDHIPYFFYQFEYISPFKYGFQALMQNEFTDLYTLTCHPNPRCDALKMANFNENLEVSIYCLIAIGVGMRLLAIIGLEKISTPKQAKILPPEQEIVQKA